MNNNIIFYYGYKLYRKKVASNLVRGNLVRVISYDLLNLIYFIIIQFLYDYI